MHFFMRRLLISNSSRLRVCALIIGALFSGVLAGCSAVQRVPDQETARGYLYMDIDPGDTRIYLDSEFHGLVDGWVARTLVLAPGDHRVELRADGYITRRFDVRIEADSQVELSIRMEPVLDQIDDFEP